MKREEYEAAHAAEMLPPLWSDACDRLGHREGVGRCAECEHDCAIIDALCAGTKTS